MGRIVPPVRPAGSSIAAPYYYTVEFDYYGDDTIEYVDAFLGTGADTLTFKHMLPGLPYDQFVGVRVIATDGTPDPTDVGSWRRVERIRIGDEFALEVDDRPSLPKNAALIDVTQKMQQYVQSVINASIVTINKAARPVSPQTTGDTLAKLVFEALGKNVPNTGVGGTNIAAVTGMEHWFNKNLDATKKEINDVPFAESRYKNIKGKGNTMKGWQPGAREHTLGPTIRVGNTLMGTDKWGHFFQQGYWLYKAERTTPPLLVSEQQRTDFSQWLEGYARMEYKSNAPAYEREYIKSIAAFAKEQDSSARWGIFGRYSTGVISGPDVKANEAGYQFYKKLASLTAYPLGNVVFNPLVYPINEFKEFGGTLEYDDFIRERLADT